jgi:hypothetical protein
MGRLAGDAERLQPFRSGASQHAGRRQLVHRYRRNQAKVVSAEHLYFVQAADRYIGELTMRVASDFDVISDRTASGVLSSVKGGLASNTLGLPGVLQREPDLRAVRRRSDVRAKRSLCALTAPSGASS